MGSLTRRDESVPVQVVLSALGQNYLFKIAFASRKWRILSEVDIRNMHNVCLELRKCPL